MTLPTKMVTSNCRPRRWWQPRKRNCRNRTTVEIPTLPAVLPPQHLAGHTTVARAGDDLRVHTIQPCAHAGRTAAQPRRWTLYGLATAELCPQCKPALLPQDVQAFHQWQQVHQPIEHLRRHFPPPTGRHVSPLHATALLGRIHQTLHQNPNPQLPLQLASVRTQLTNRLASHRHVVVRQLAATTPQPQLTPEQHRQAVDQVTWCDTCTDTSETTTTSADDREQLVVVAIDLDDLHHPNPRRPAPIVEATIGTAALHTPPAAMTSRSSHQLLLCTLPEPAARSVLRWQPHATALTPHHDPEVLDAVTKLWDGHIPQFPVQTHAIATALTPQPSPAGR